jgi:hypothetical protein
MNEKIDHMQSLANKIDQYNHIIYSQCEKNIPRIKKLEKISDDEIILPTIHDYDIVIKYNYNRDQLRGFLKYYKLKLSGNKKEVVNRIYCYLRLSYYAIKIQKIVRGKLQRTYNFLHGPAFVKRELCTNHFDFLSMEPMNEISFSQFISYKDIDNFIYGFDLISLYNLIHKSEKRAQNPYNRASIPEFLIINMKRILKLGKILKIHTDIDIKDVFSEVSAEKSLDLRIVGLFQNIDSLGHYSSAEWFTSLNRLQLVKFIRELIDIWNYRAQITHETKRNICPHQGDPFRNLSLNYVMTESDINNVKKVILDVLEKIVNSGVDRDSKSLGAYYVLGALTLVNESAALSIPWLYQSFSYF